ncbi:hypothetical protein [Lysinibacillus xylanilyticus]
MCESEATATMFYLCESEATATKEPSRNGNQPHVVAMIHYIGIVSF